MAQGITKSELAAVIHDEVAKYVDREFGDGEGFVSDLELASDDLSAIALTLEKRFNVKIERRRYREVSNVDDYADLFAEALGGGEAR
ncbi:hypothetical protein [Sphingomonas quercus]|uniref:Acyl carrier protein n=1 Tax=Sphingomonas quercus TaxID=2842451 RepID=A0ABS6BK94_9SPHN|nr:hypothetical protein [Sphingomonas quercus]MBU3077679.1 hypothetical protein [Sphingomonas quercus]